MAGRRRRASASSVETVDGRKTLWRSEKSVVRSVSKDVPSDDWPIFELRNAIVLSKEGKNIANALLVGLEGPFTVRGELVIDDPSQKEYILMRLRLRESLPLEIHQSTSYSIGESADGRPLIWVSGQGGWYEIDPCPAYKPMYNKMCEATTMFYKILDIYEQGPPKRPKRARNWSFKDDLGLVFHRYASRIGDGSTLEEVFARVDEHAAFFLDKFASNDGTIDWKTTAFYKYVTSTHEELRKRLQAALDKLRRPPLETDAESSLRFSARSRPKRSSSVNMADVAETATKPSQRSKTRSATPRLVEQPSRTSPPEAKPAGTVVPHYVWTERDRDVESPFHLALTAFKDVIHHLSLGGKAITVTGFLSRLYFMYSVPNYRDEGRVGAYKQSAQEWLHYYSKALLHMLDSSDRELGIYDELQRLATTDLVPLAYKPSEFPIFIRSRKTMPRKPAHPPVPPPPPLPPVVSNENDDNDDNDDDHEDETPSVSHTPTPRGKRPTRTPGKSSLRPVSRVSRKRTRGELESQSPSGRRSPFLDEGEDSMDVDTDSSRRHGDDDDGGEEDNDDDEKFRLDLAPIKLVIRADKLPDPSPRGPHDTWTCDQEDCGFFVRGADGPDAKDCIRQHLEDHEEQLARVNLAVSEASRGRLPISHLLDKIKQMSGEPQDSQPIKRKLIV